MYSRLFFGVRGQGPIVVRRFVWRRTGYVGIRSTIMLFSPMRLQHRVKVDSLFKGNARNFFRFSNSSGIPRLRVPRPKCGGVLEFSVPISGIGLPAMFR